MNTKVENNPLFDDAVVFVKQGFQLVEQQRLDEAVASFDRAIALKPDLAEALISRGIVLFYLGRFEDAVASYDRVLALRPDAEAFSHRGLALYTLGRLDEAVASYDHALALKPDAQAFNTRGRALYKLGRLEEAVASYGSALALQPDDAEAFNSRATALAQLGRLDQALHDIDRAIALGSGSAEICLAVGGVFLDHGRFDDALACYDRALAFNPDHADVRFHRALALLGTGDFARGFEDYRWRFRIEDEARRPDRPDCLACPDWEGEPLAGKRLVVFVEQGYGDALQFVRYVPMAQARGAHVTLLAPSALLRLLRASLPGVEVTDRLPDTAVFDYQAPMLCLPRLFGTTLETIPAQTPYLVADQDTAATWAQRLAALPGRKVGLVWAGSSRLPSIDARRSLSLAQFAPLAAIPGVQFISLQIGEPAVEAKTPPAGLRLVDWTGKIGDYADTAALVAGLDLVITVDTSVAHLAGGLGKPVWILSRYDGCWRWLQGREDSPWYPTARLFHQPAPGQWDPVMAKVAAALQAFASRPPAPSPAQISDAVAYAKQGMRLSYQQRPDEAVANFDQALALKPDFVEVLISRGIALFSLGRFADAVASYDGALALQPDPEVFSIRGLALYMLGRFDEAVLSHDRALALKPDYAEAHVNRAHALLRAGDLARGFEAYRWRFQINERPVLPEGFTCPEWEGEPLAGKRLVILAEQGYGDALQFVRYVPMAQARGAHVTLLAPSALLRLLRASLPGVEVTDRLPDTAVFDYQAPMLCLPRLFGTTLDTVPAGTPYLAADQTASATWAQRLAALPGRKVGLVWAGGRERSYDERRSLNLAQLAPLADVPGVQFVSLQLGEPAQEAQTPPAGFNLLDWTDEISDFADTAALVSSLDLVITVDTSVAHLAGGLGKPVWILSRYGGCWRWLPNRQDSPWYRTARLFHQPAPGQWEPVVAEVASALQAEVADADAFSSRGLALYNLGRLDEALASYDRALALRPDHAETHFNRAAVLLRAGDLARGFEAYRQCLQHYGKQRELAAFACPDWNGESLVGKRLVIFTEHGYGDTLQFVRYVRMAVARGAQVTLLVRPELLRLLRASLPGVEVADQLPKTAVFDFQIPMLCLPALFGTTLDTIPARTPYLLADPAAAAAWSQRLAALPGLKVGLVWAGDKQRPFNELRSLKLAQFAPLAAIPGVQFINLQLGEPAQEAQTPPAGLRLTDWTGEISDFADTAALVAGLDLVITVCTSMAHLAGALGKPVWVLLRYDSCWRWLMNREDSPWYQTARLFRQQTMGDWDPVMANAAAALKTLAQENSVPPTATGLHADAVALVKQGFRLFEQQRFDEAIAGFDQAIAFKPDFAEALISRSLVLLHLGRLEEAVASYDRVLALGPDADAFSNRGLALYKLDRFDEAAASYGRALALKPDAQAFNIRGLALYKLGRYDEAVASYDGALALQPDDAEAHNSRAAALAKLGRIDQALDSVDRAIALKSPSSAAVCQDIAVALHNLGRPGAALAFYDRMLALDPDHADMRFQRAMALLSTGDLKRGFEDYRWRFLVENRTRPIKPDWITCPEWNGEPIAGKRLVIYVEQGYGDSLQFVRYAPMAQACGAHVTLFIPPALRELLRASMPPGIEVADRLPDTAVFDYQVPMLCLPRIFGTTLDTIPADMPYLLADRDAAAAWSRRLAALPGLKVGLVWAGGKSLPSVDARRSLSLAQFAPLASVPGVQFISLQIGEPAAEARTPPAGLKLVDWTGEISDYADTAALIAGLDLVIAVDTSVAHLAGALGKPVWILSRYDGCWRWLQDRDDTPWYPTARLFRQAALGEWEPVMAKVETALQAFASRHA